MNNINELNSFLTKNMLIKYKSQNPSKYEHKFGHLNLDVIEDGEQKFTDKKDIEMFINYVSKPVVDKEVKTEQEIKDVEINTRNKGEVGEGIQASPVVKRTK